MKEKLTPRQVQRMRRKAILDNSQKIDEAHSPAFREITSYVIGGSTFGEVARNGYRVAELHQKLSDAEKKEFHSFLIQRQKDLQALVDSGVEGEDFHRCKSTLGIIKLFAERLNIPLETT